MLGFGIPLLTTWLRYLPHMDTFVQKVRPYIVGRATLGYTTCDLSRI
jgi:hypothetical protein